MESRCIVVKSYLKEDYLVPKERVRSESYPKCEPSVDRFSRLLDRSFRLGFPIRFGYLSLVFSLRVGE